MPPLAVLSRGDQPRTWRANTELSTFFKALTLFFKYAISAVKCSPDRAALPIDLGFIGHPELYISLSWSSV
jgi:hypothetical protein